MRLDSTVSPCVKMRGRRRKYGEEGELERLLHVSVFLLDLRMYAVLLYTGE